MTVSDLRAVWCAEIRLSKWEFDHSTLRDVLVVLHRYREKERETFEINKSLALLAGNVACMPYMKESDRRRFIQSIENPRASKTNYTDEELQTLLNHVAQMDQRDVWITKPDGTKIIGIWAKA